jgi:peptidoglycan/LPS O-acetylase OafA/YrhL
MKYRPEIDGLRAAAVIPVILFHAGFSTFSGGFVGVDVFFVISGYLITTIILAEMEQGTFSLVNFYERRARRILPALFLVMFVSLPFAWFWLLPRDMKDFSQSLIAVSSFSSNILFWRNFGYWNAANELKPLLHTWSLAVEEQYYVLFPLFLMLMWRYRKRWILGSFMLVAGISLAIAQWGAYHKPRATFYLLPTRGWELAIGAGIAFYFLYRKQNIRTLLSHKSVNEVLVLVGLLMIGYAIFAFDENTPFPGLYALVPTIGAGLIILFSSSQTMVGRLLSAKPLVAIGLISYSAYLWHQPLLVFARHISLTEPSETTYAILAFLSLPLAYLSWRFVEKPFRTKGVFSRKAVFSFAAIVSALFTAVGLAGLINDGWTDRFDSRLLTLDQESGCFAEKFLPEKVCHLVENPNKLTMLIGDSHANALAHEMQATFEKEGIGLLHSYHVGCPPIENVYRADKGPEKNLDSAPCYMFNKGLYDYIEKNNEIEYVVMAARWSLTMEGSRFNNQEGGIETSKYVPHLDLVVNGKPEYHPDYGHRSQIAKAYADSVQKLLGMGKKVILIYQVPEAGWDVPRYLYKIHNIIGETGSTSHDVFKERNRRSYAALDSIGEHKNLFRIKPESIFCSNDINGRCVVQKNGIPYYIDDDHLSYSGARLIVNEVLGYIQCSANIANKVHHDLTTKKDDSTNLTTNQIQLHTARENNTDKIAAPIKNDTFKK